MLRKLTKMNVVAILLAQSFAFAGEGEERPCVLVTGGAGYIGSHTVHQLNDRGEKVVVLDNLYSGHRRAIPAGVELIVGNCGDTELVKKIIQEKNVESVIHFAAHIEVEESMRNPAKYYDNNTGNSARLIRTCEDNGVKHFIFSSTCAVYGNVKEMPVEETAPTSPMSPYADSKLMTEKVLQAVDQSAECKLRHVILRYFNVAGARVQGGIGQSTPRATSLIKSASEAAVGKRDHLDVFGTDYNTEDGSCERDFIHVDDLAKAHILSLEYLRAGNSSNLFNCGYGKPYSVLSVVRTMKQTTGTDFGVEVSGRRPGDIVQIYAQPLKIKTVLGWTPEHEDLNLICKTAYDWEKVTNARAELEREIRATIHREYSEGMDRL